MEHSQLNNKLAASDITQYSSIQCMQYLFRHFRSTAHPAEEHDTSCNHSNCICACLAWQPTPRPMVRGENSPRLPNPSRDRLVCAVTSLRTRHIRTLILGKRAVAYVAGVQAPPDCPLHHGGWWISQDLLFCQLSRQAATVAWWSLSAPWPVLQFLHQPLRT